MSREIRIGVAGAGATGAFLAAVLAEAGYDVSLLTRGSSTGFIRQNGITVNGPGCRSISSRPTAVLEAGDEIDPADITLFCVKSYDTLAAAEAMGSLVGEEGLILCLQNGVANEEELAKVYGPHRVLSGVLYIGSERTAPGVIHCSSPAKIIFGPYREEVNASQAVSLELRDAFNQAGVEASIDASIQSAKWQKFLFNCGLNALTAITGQPLGTIRSHPSGKKLYTNLVAEAIAAARASGAPLATDALEQAEATADRMDISSSMAGDLAAQRTMELDIFSGHVLRLADKYGTSAAVTAVIHQLLEVLGAGARANRAIGGGQGRSFDTR